MANAIGQGETLGSKLGGVMAGIGKAAITGLAVAGTAFAGLSIKALQMGGDLEQSVGGIETLFKGSADTVIANAERAYLTAGVNANDYMQQVTSFSASLLQSLGGDTEAAVAAADMAIVDMSDNANKMGSSIESIQLAYQGFARGQFGLLDNLKLGYGGTKTEMERLLTDAEKISGIKYDISNLNDIYNAVHVIQEELDITGTTALEGMTTLNGALATTGAAFSNFLSGAGDFQPVIDSFSNLSNIVVDRLGEMLPRLTEGLTGIAQGLLPKIPEIFAQLLPAVIEGASGLINGVISVLPALVTTITDAFPQFVTAILSMLPLMVQAGIDIVASLSTGISFMLPELIPQIVQAIINLAATITSNVGVIQTSGFELIDGLISGIANSIPFLVQEVPKIIEGLINAFGQNVMRMATVGESLLDSLTEGIQTYAPMIMDEAPAVIDNFITGIVDALPGLIDTGIEILTTLIDTIVQNLPLIIQTAATIVISLFTSIVNNLPKIIEGGAKIVGALIDGILKLIPVLVVEGLNLILSLAGAIIQNLPKILEAGKQIVTTVITGVNELGGKILDVGKNIVDGVWKGISSKAGELATNVKNFFTGILQSAKDALAIKSPSGRFRDEVGAMIVEGTVDGIDENADKAAKAAAKMAKMTYANAKLWIEDYRNDTDYLATEEIKMWEELLTVYTDVSKERVEIEKNITKLQAAAIKEREKAEKDNFDRSTNWITVRKKLGILSFEDEQAAYLRMQNTYAEGTEYREKIDIAMHESQVKHAEAQQKIFNESENILEKMANAEENYQKAVDSRAQAIMNSFGAFDELKKREDISSETLFKNLSDQTAAMEQWATMFQELSSKGINEGLLADLQGMGDDALPYLQTLTRMSDTELQKYSAQYGEYQAIAREQAGVELEGLRKDTDKEIKGLVDDLNKVASTNFVFAGENTTQGFIDGIRSKFDDLRAATAEMASIVSDTITSELEIASPSKLSKRFGGFWGEGFIIGVDNMAGKISNALSSVFSAVPPDTSLSANLGVSGGMSSVTASSLTTPTAAAMTSSSGIVYNITGNTITVDATKIKDITDIINIFKSLPQNQVVWEV